MAHWLSTPFSDLSAEGFRGVTVALVVSVKIIINLILIYEVYWSTLNSSVFMTWDWFTPWSALSIRNPMHLNLKLLCVPVIIEAETRWQPFCRWYFQLYFPEKNVCISKEISLNIVSKDSVDNSSVLVQIMAWNLFRAKTLSDAMMTSFSNAYMCQSTLMTSRILIKKGISYHYIVKTSWFCKQGKVLTRMNYCCMVWGYWPQKDVISWLGAMYITLFMIILSSYSKVLTL